jgi:glycosyltransferase involved in cell wall biosynthesis
MTDKIYTIVQMLPELKEGGVEIGTLQLSNYLSVHGHHSIVISAGGPLVPQIEKNGGIHIRYCVGKKSLKCLQYILPIRHLLIREKVDILHLDSRLPAWIGYLAAKTLPKRIRPRIITTFHGFHSVNWYSAIMTKGDIVIAVSNAVKNHIVDQYHIPESRVRVIYRGIDEEKFNPDSVTIPRINGLKIKWHLKNTSDPIILLPARLTHLKGHEIFIKSLALIKELSWTAICVGNFNKNSSRFVQIQKLISQLGLDQRVKFVGHCDDMACALMVSDIVVSASIEPEGFGLTLVEAQAMGKPVIATAHGGSLETVFDGLNGWLVEPGNDNHMAKALKQGVLNQELRIRLGKEGQKLVKHRFTIQKMCQKTLVLYPMTTKKD